MNDGLKDRHREKIIEIIAGNDKVERAVLFGSRAMGTYTSASDIDIALFGDALTLTDQADLSEKMSELTVPQKVDLLRYKNIKNKKLRQHIDKHGIEWLNRKKKNHQPNEWKETTLKDISVDVSYGYTESASSEKVGPHFLRITDIQNGVVDWNTVPYCPISDADLTKYRLENGDIVVARTGNSTGENYIFDANTEAVFASYLIRFKIDSQKASPYFVWYSMRSKNWWAFINGSKTGSAQAGANAKVLGRFPIKLPSLAEQKQIAHILGTLDDKIELNRRMNRTLEAMARAIFKSWFVDFDPVIDNALAADNPIPDELKEKADRRKKQKNKKPLPKEIKKLFPDSFIDPPLGPIPKGWETGELGDVAENLKRQVRPEEVNEETPYIGLEHMPKGSIALDSWGTAEQIASNKFAFYAGEILFGKLRPYFHKVGVPVTDGICSTDILVIAPKTENLFGLALSHVSSRAFIEHTTSHSSGTRMPRTSWKDMAQYQVVLPHDDLMTHFNGIMQRHVSKIKMNILESKTLTHLRDTLLPKLLTGAIDISKAEILASEVA